MKSLAAAASARHIDMLSQKECRIPSLSLMENASLAAFNALFTDEDSKKRILFVCGPGNNGGDCLVMAREAVNRGFTDITVIVLGSRLSPMNLVQYDILRSMSDGIIRFTENMNFEFTGYDIIVDGLFGIGLDRALDGMFRDAVLNINRSGADIYSIDVPSGIGDSVPADQIHVIAHRTATFGFSKTAFHHPALIADCGEITVLPSPFPLKIRESFRGDAFTVDQEDLEISPLARDDYKNTRGHLAVFGGCEKFTGAVRLASRSAFSSRCGLVSVFCDEEIHDVIAGDSPSLIVSSTLNDADFSRYGAVLAGPGWGPDRKDLMNILIRQNCRLIVDADGIRAFCELDDIQHEGGIILTPHIGELNVLVRRFVPEYEFRAGVNDSPDDYWQLLKTLALRTNAIIVAKGASTSIAAPSSPIVSVSYPNPSLGVAGSGDVLSGCISALACTDISLFKSAVYGTLVHSRAGRLANTELGFYDSETLAGYIGRCFDL